ncbi:hypothetical protein [Neobacillus sp. MER 74]|nr:hypothetical protein [Neobacillus sp. MER 74]
MAKAKLIPYSQLKLKMGALLRTMIAATVIFLSYNVAGSFKNDYN